MAAQRAGRRSPQNHQDHLPAKRPEDDGAFARWAQGEVAECRGGDDCDNRENNGEDLENMY